MPASRVLFVLDGAGDASPEGAEARSSEWADRFLAVLRKHGWLEVELAAPSVLSDAHRLRGHDVVIVSRLADWEASWLRGLRAFDGIMFLEGPVPPLLERFTGIESVPEEHPVACGQLRVRKWLRDALTAAGCELGR